MWGQCADPSEERHSGRQILPAKVPFWIWSVQRCTWGGAGGRGGGGRRLSSTGPSTLAPAGRPANAAPSLTQLMGHSEWNTRK